MEKNMLSEKQKNEVLKLISYKQEGAYWDFKKQWYEDGKQADLLHDIICMANNLENRDAYIIIGIDEEKDYCVNDLTNSADRKTTQMLVDFLRNKKFMGGIKPHVMVEPEISLLENNIPVLPRAHPAEWGIPLLKEKSLFFLDKQPKRTPFIV